MEMDQTFTFGIDQQMALPPTHILDGLSVFDGTSRFHNPTHFVDELEQFIMEFPEMSHLLGGIGEPLSGKLSVVAEIMSLLTHPGSKLQQFADEHDFLIQKYLLTWGEPFEVIKNKDLPAEMSWKAKSRIQTPQAVPIFFNSLARTISGYGQETGENRVIRLIGYDAVAFTGMAFDGDREYGLVRANREMEQLARHTGPFEGLTYSDWRMAIAAENSLRADNKQFRAAILGARSVEERMRILQIWNKTLLLGEDKHITAYGSDEASIANTEEIEEEMEDLAEGLVRHGLIDVRKYGTLTCAQDLIYPYGALGESRDRIIGEIVNPKMFELTGANPYMSVYFFNATKSNETVLNLEGYKSPVRDLYYPKA